MNIRNITKQDCEALYLLCIQVEKESQFALLEPFEKAASLEEQCRLISSILQNDNRAIFVAELDGDLVGYLGVFAGDYPLNNHCAKVTMGILRDHAGKGIGRMLFEKLDAWSAEHQIHRLELNVSTHNELAINLFILVGFQYEGARHDSLRNGVGYMNEYCMAKLLE